MVAATSRNRTYGSSSSGGGGQLYSAYTDILLDIVVVFVVNIIHIRQAS